ncbi:salivary C-type lectin 1-like [Branchiostoma floridae x Branchiostoma japonicum]
MAVIATGVVVGLIFTAAPENEAEHSLAASHNLTTAILLANVSTTEPAMTKIWVPPTSVHLMSHKSTANEALTRNGCQTGYKLLLTTCIRLDFRQKNYWGAREACEREGATLAMPKTKELDLALRNLVSKEGHNLEPWIGLKDNNYFRLLKRQWQWEDGSALRNYKGWNPGVPNNRRLTHRTRLCVHYWPGRTGYHMWNDLGCSRRRGFICQTFLA